MPADLAALAIRPSDTAQFGWQHGGAFFESIDGIADIEAAYLGQGVAAANVRDTLQGYGWQREYVDTLELPSALDSSVIDQRIRSSITEYRSPEGAAAGFAFLEDEHTVPSATDVPASRTFGEQSELTKERGESAIDGRPYQSLDLTFRVGNLVAGVALVVYPNATTTAPDQALLESLAALVEARVTAGAGAAPNLGSRAVRLDEFDHRIVTYEDAYIRIDGADVPLSGESTSAAELRTESYLHATDVYQIWLGVDIGSTRGYLYGVTLLAFPTNEDAEAWTADVAGILGENPFYGDLQSAGEIQGIGDQAIALRYIAGGGADAPHAMLVAVRVGNLVARVHIVPQGVRSDIPLTTVLAAARAEAACLGAPGCSGITLAPALDDLPIATPAA
jgi:hypothetical protein